MLVVPDEILDAFGVRWVAPLGGRLNQHWHVEAGRERLVLRRWATTADDVDYELRLLESVAALGWPVAPAIGRPIQFGGHLWSLFPFLPGEPPSALDPAADQRARGRLLAEFHAGLVSLDTFGQRGTWRRCEQILADPALDRILNEHEREHSEEVRIVRWHLDRARRRAAELPLWDRPGIIVHGDFTTWNLRFQNGRLSGILDFELAHWDHRIADFVLSWRGKYDAVIAGYNEVLPLASEEWELLTPVWWSQLVEDACRNLKNGFQDDGWTLKKLLQRSPLMGPDAAPWKPTGN